jgi:hypothetical protein
MKKFELIRMLFDMVMANGEAYSKADAISADCTRDGLVNRVYIKKVKVEKAMFGAHVDNVSITCAKEDYSDATDADVRVEFPSRTILWANELSDKMLAELVNVMKINLGY